MAFEITNKIKTRDNFETQSALMDLFIVIGSNGVLVKMLYYKSKADYKNNKGRFLPDGQPKVFDLTNELTYNEIWGKGTKPLLDLVHDKIKVKLDAIHGASKVKIIKDPKA
ncbi:MAG: hypothetical protein ACUZ8H_16420 [Candidatus Anammoxibacter sp.]